MITKQEIRVLISKYKQEGLKNKEIENHLRELFKELKINSEFNKFKEVIKLNIINS